MTDRWDDGFSYFIYRMYLNIANVFNIYVHKNSTYLLLSSMPYLFPSPDQSDMHNREANAKEVEEGVYEMAYSRVSDFIALKPITFFLIH